MEGITGAVGNREREREREGESERERAGTAMVLAWSGGSLEQCHTRASRPLPQFISQDLNVNAVPCRANPRDIHNKREAECVPANQSSALKGPGHRAANQSKCPEVVGTHGSQ